MHSLEKNPFRLDLGQGLLKAGLSADFLIAQTNARLYSFVFAESFLKAGSPFLRILFSHARAD
jgi:hypothetical protein